VRAWGPRAANRAELWVDHRRILSGRTFRGRASFRLRGRAGRRVRVSVRFLRGRRLVARAAADDVWLLPRGSRRARRPHGHDRRLAARLASLGARYDGWTGIWTHDLATGRTAGWNADASFPAASLVKLGVLVAALDRFGAEPRNATVAGDIRELAVRSSNLASNRLVVALGGSERAGAQIVEATLHRLGAVSSTFTGFYRIDSAVRSDAPRPPPFLAYRRTTASDIGRVLFELHAAAAGNRLALRRARLSLHEARVAVGLLLGSDPGGENVGLFGRLLGPALPAAQKHGWTTSLRHSAAIVYTVRGPVIVVVLTYRPTIRPLASRSLAERVLRAVLT
jgi:hypothetical protein